jgi:PAS domain S-box-containing protein
MKLARKIEIVSISSESETDRHVHRLVPGIKSFSKYVGFAVSLIGVLVVLSWLVGLEQLNNVFAELTSMEANTAIAFIAAGLSLWLRASTNLKLQTAAKVLAVITGLIGLLTLGEYLSGRDFGIDQLLFKDLAVAGVLHPGRMSFISALNFTMLGMALLLIDSNNEHRYNLAQSLTLVTGMIAYIALSAHVFGVDSLYHVGVFAPMAFHTALSFVLLVVGIICAQPEDGWAGNLLADNLGGDLLRRLLPVAFVVPILLAWFRLQGQLAGYYDTSLGTTLLAIASTFLLSIIIWFNAKGLSRVDNDRRRVEQNLRESEERYHTLFESIDEGFCIIEKVESKAGEPLDFRYIVANQAFAAHSGVGHVVGKTIRQAFPGEIEEWFLTYDAVLRTGEPIRFERGLVTHGRVLELYAFRVADGTHRRVAVIFKDITERKQAEDALQFARDQAEQTADRIARLQRVTAALSEALTPLQVARIVVEQGAPALGAVSGTVMLLAEDGQNLEIVYSASPQPVIQPYQHFPISLRVPAADAARSGEPVWIESRQQYLERYPHLADQIKLWDHQSALAIPMFDKGRMLGVLALSFDSTLPYTPKDQDYVLTLARQGAQALERARLYEAEQKARRVATEFAQQQEALYKLTNQLQRTNSLEDVFNAALDAILGALRCDRASILLFNDSDLMHFVAWRGLSDNYRKSTDGHSPWKPDEKNAEPISINDIATGEISDSLRTVIQENGIGSLAFIPLVSDGKLIGKFMTYYNTPHVFSEGELELSLTIARQLAFGIERKQAEEALRENERRFREMIDALPTAIYTTDAEGLLTHFNPAAVEFSGRVPELGTDRWCISLRLYHPDGTPLPHDQCPMALAIKEGRVVRGTQAIAERPDGKRIWFEPYPTPLRNSKGRIVGGINMLVDITERKQAEESLRESEERFRAILRQATAGIVRKDAEGKLLFVNEAFCNMLGYTESELLGKTIWQLTHNDDVEENKRLYDRTMVEGTPFKLEKRLIRRDGSILWVNVSVSPIMDATGRPESAVAVEVDITGRKQAEEALRDLNIQLESRVQNRTVKLQEANQSLLNEIAERQKAEEALHASGKRLQILSQRLVEVQEEERRAIARELHDSVGQSLSALNINLVILDNQISNSADEQIRTRLNDSMQLTAETISLVRDVMSDLRPSVLDDYGLEAALQSYLDQFKSRYAINVLFEKPDQPIRRLGSSIEMTFLRIAQEALLNIARHAHADQVNLLLEPDGNAVRLIVQDNGSGIESWPEANRPGSHGLTIMRERADAVGGTLRVLSVPGQGTKVEVSIPVENGSLQTVQEERRE